jgi:hypothetical protein
MKKIFFMFFFVINISLLYSQENELFQKIELGISLDDFLNIDEIKNINDGILVTIEEVDTLTSVNVFTYFFDSYGYYLCYFIENELIGITVDISSLDFKEMNKENLYNNLIPKISEQYGIGISISITNKLANMLDIFRKETDLQSSIKLMQWEKQDNAIYLVYENWKDIEHLTLYYGDDYFFNEYKEFIRKLVGRKQ